MERMPYGKSMKKFWQEAVRLVEDCGMSRLVSTIDGRG